MLAWAVQETTMYEPLVMLSILVKLSKLLWKFGTMGLITFNEMIHLYRRTFGDGVEKHAKKEPKNDA